MKKQDIMEIKISEMKFPNIGIGTIGEKKVQIKGALPGQRLLVNMRRSGKKAKGEVLEVLEKAPQEIVPKCSVFGSCGGCSFQNIPYNYEIELKTEMVKRILAPFDLTDYFLPTIPATDTESYRNKMEYSFGDDGPEGNLTLGMRKKGSYYEAVDARDCLIAHPDFGKILAFTQEYFRAKKESFHHRRKRTGSLRHLVIRRSPQTKEILVNLVTISGSNYNDFAQKLLEVPLDGKIVGILNTINDSLADAVIPEEINILYGRDFYYEQLGNLRFKVSAFSFFQTNSTMAADALYPLISDYISSTSTATLFDLYCGTGTIGIFLASSAERVLGIEIVEEAISAAKENASLNNIKNCQFIAGDVRKMVKELDEAPEVIILDPPREGINPKAMPDILAFSAPVIIYVSCKPTSLANDLPAFFDAGYRLTKIQCVDMFPRTGNIEVVAELRRK